MFNSSVWLQHLNFLRILLRAHFNHWAKSLLILWFSVVYTLPRFSKVNVSFDQIGDQISQGKILPGPGAWHYTMLCVFSYEPAPLCLISGNIFAKTFPPALSTHPAYNSLPSGLGSPCSLSLTSNSEAPNILNKIINPTLQGFRKLQFTVGEGIMTQMILGTTFGVCKSRLTKMKCEGCPKRLKKQKFLFLPP